MPTPSPTPSAGTPPPVQLRLATGDGDYEAVKTALTKTALHLHAIQDALELVHAVADRRVPLDHDTVDRLRRALNTLDAAGPLPGRLGYLTRLLNTGPIGDFADIVSDLAFTVHLNDGSAGRAEP
jgi:hypothetical protein